MNEMKNDKLDTLITMSAHVLAEKNADDLLNTDTSDVCIPKNLDRKIKRMIKREREKREYGSWYIIFKNVAACLLIVCAVTFTMIMNIEAVRNALWNTMVKWFGNYISVTHVTDEYVPTTIETKMQPTVYPEEWEIDVAIDNIALYSVDYICNGEPIIFYNQWLLNHDDMRIDSKNASVTEVTIGEYDGKLFTYSDDVSKILIWSNGEYSFSLTARDENISSEQLIKIAESVK